MIDYSFVPAKSFEEAMMNLKSIIAMLRSPEGCPWDKVQTKKDTTQALLNETYEYLDALEGSVEDQREEVGDIFLNSVFLLSLHEGSNEFAGVDAINEVCEKLVRRHPHVFSDKSASTPEEVKALWDNVKSTETKHKNQGFFSSIPKSAPVLDQSYQIQKKLKKVGFDFLKEDDIYAKIAEELEEFRNAADEDSRQKELGDILFAVVDLALAHKLNPTTALHMTNQKAIRRFEKVIEATEKSGLEVSKDNFEFMDSQWTLIKNKEKGK